MFGGFVVLGGLVVFDGFVVFGGLVVFDGFVVLGGLVVFDGAPRASDADRTVEAVAQSV